MNNGKREIQSRKRYLLAFLIGTFIFILGFGITYSFSYLQYQRISDFQDVTSYSIFSDKLSYSLFEKDICLFSNFQEISEDLGFQGRIIDDLEKKLGKEDPSVLFRKKFYTLVELEHFEFINAFNRECNKEIPTILFFYSNKEDDLGRSEDVGRMLDTLSRGHEDLVIYSFDINLDSRLIRELADKYDILESPTVIVNGQHRITDFSDIDNIGKFLGKSLEYDEDVIRL